MKRNSSKTNSNNHAARLLWIGPVMGLACMAALFIAGAVQANAGMMVMASTMAALLGTIWASTTAAAKKKAASESACA